MLVQFSVYAVPLLLSAAVTAALGYLLWKRSAGSLFSADGGVALVQFAVLTWALGSVLYVVAVPPPGKLLGVYLTDIGISATGPAWLLVALKYTGNEDWLTRPRAAAVAGLPVLGALALVTNEPTGFHDLYLTGLQYAVEDGRATLAFESGPARLVYAGLMWAMHLAGNYFMAGKLVASRNVYRKRTFVLMAADLTIVATTVVSFTQYNPAPFFSLGPMVYTVFAALSLLILASYRTLQYIPVDRALGVFSSRSKSLAPTARNVIMEEIDSGVLVLDHENRLVDINPLGRRMVGAGDDRVIGKDLRDLVAEEVFEDGSPAYADPDVTEGKFTGIWVRTPEGERRCFDVTVTPMTDDGEVTGRVLLVHDVTRREERKQKLEERTEELERQNEQLEDFASIVSHDLRNPLNVAKGAVDLAERKDDPQFFETLRQSHDRMESIIDDVLTLARQGRTVEQTEAVDLAAVATEAWSHVDTKDATVDVAVDRVVEGDRGRLSRLFENLFRNSVEHGAEDVRVVVGPLPDGFFVEDDGPGIPVDHHDEVLEQGFTTSESGTGLGLAIVGTVVDAHGWAITVTDGSEGGARFEITGVDAVDDAGLPEGRSPEPSEQF